MELRQIFQDKKMVNQTKWKNEKCRTENARPSVKGAKSENKIAFRQKLETVLLSYVAVSNKNT